MQRVLIAALFAACLGSVCVAAERPHPQVLDDLIAQYARMHGVPVSLVHRVVARESSFQPQAFNHRFYGLMQITYPTACSMGYHGAPKGLLDPAVNLTYGVPYLANAYLLAGRNAARAIRLYSAGYYFTAKRKKLLGALRTAASRSLAAQSALPQPASASTH